MPRESKYNERIKNRMVEALRLGHFINEACSLAGISIQTFYNWKKKAEDGEEPFVDFIDAVEEAQSEAVEDALQNIRKAGRDDWKAEAWFLERRKKDWLKTDKVELSGDEEKPVVIELVWADDLGKEKKEKKKDD